MDNANLWTRRSKYVLAFFFPYFYLDGIMGKLFGRFLLILHRPLAPPSCLCL
jgi:hypothetical protein